MNPFPSAKKKNQFGTDDGQPRLLLGLGSDKHLPGYS